MSAWTIRAERPGDELAISSVVHDAFANLPPAHRGGGEVTEHLTVEGLRADHALTVSLVAEADGAIVGHVAFSPVSISDGSKDWYGLGPVAVSPALQGQGIGGALIRTGLEVLRDQSAAGCTVLGDPRYYGRFAFSHDPALTYPFPISQAFQRQAFAGAAPGGEVTYHPAFG